MIARLKGSSPLLTAHLTALIADAHWTGSMVSETLDDSQREVWGWWKSGEPAQDAQPDAFCIVSVGPFELEIEMIVVAESQRRKGIARALVKHVQERVKKLNKEQLFLEVRQSNTAAQHLYLSQHMERVGRRKGYYSNPDGKREDALLFSWAPGVTQD